jgi:quercetin 2,3-dioxygenase
MTAGTGVAHSEFNPSRTEPVHLLQIWILPKARNLPPSYEQKFFSEDERRGKLRLIASPDAGNGAVTINQDARVYACSPNQDESIEHVIDQDRHAWIQVARGALNLNGVELNQGDGAAISQETRLRIVAHDQAELLLFDLA